MPENDKDTAIAASMFGMLEAIDDEDGIRPPREEQSAPGVHIPSSFEEWIDNHPNRGEELVNILHQIEDADDVEIEGSDDEVLYLITQIKEIEYYVNGTNRLLEALNIVDLQGLTPAEQGTYDSAMKLLGFIKQHRPHLFNEEDED